MRLFALAFLFLFSAFGQVAVTFQAVPSEARAYFRVTGSHCQPGTYFTPATLNWFSGPDCTVEALTPPDTGMAFRDNFYAWDDLSTARIRAFPVPESATTRSLRTQRELQLTTLVDPPGSATITGAGWYPYDTKVRIQVTPNPGFLFVRWGGISFANGGDDPPWVEVTTSYGIAATAFLRPTIVAQLPHQYTVTRMAGFGNIKPGSFNQAGALVSYRRQGTDPEMLWTPDSPNSPFGTVRYTEGLSPHNQTWSGAGPLLNDDGRILNVRTDSQVVIWSPSAPGSASGTETPISDASRAATGDAAAFNRHGQVAITYGGIQQQALWTPNSPGATAGTSVVDARLGNALAMNNFGQVLAKPEFLSAGVVFRLFTPAAPNSGLGTFTEVPMPIVDSSVFVRALSPLGAVAGAWCTPQPDGPCRTLGYLWQPDNPNGPTGRLIPLAAPSGLGDVVRVYGLNSSGDMVGSLGDPSYLPFVRLNGEYYDLAQVPGVGPNATPVAINDTGQIVMSTNADETLLLTPHATPPVPPANAVPVTINSSVAGGAFTVSGAGCQPGAFYAPRTLWWTPGANCQLQWSSTLSHRPTFRTRFTGWADGPAANARVLTTPAAATTYTATFVEEVELRLLANPANAGTVTGGGWFVRGAKVVSHPVLWTQRCSRCNRLCLEVLLPGLSRRSVPELPDQPLLVVPLDEFRHRSSDVLDILKHPAVDDLLLEGPVESLRHAVGLRLRDEGKTGLDAPMLYLVLEMV